MTPERSERSERSERPERLERSERSFGFWSTTALVAGHTIAVGIFLTPAQLIGALASPALTLGLWLACGALVLAGALTFGELASRYPQAGGLYVYLQKGWGSQIAFLYGWQSLLVMDPGVTAALAAGLAQYLVVIWPAAAGTEPWLAVAAIWILALISIAGMTLSARVFTAMTALKLLALAGVVLAAFAVGDGRLVACRTVFRIARGRGAAGRGPGSRFDRCLLLFWRLLGSESRGRRGARAEPYAPACIGCRGRLGHGCVRCDNDGLHILGAAR